MWNINGYEAETIEKLADEIAEHCADNERSLPDFDTLYWADEDYRIATEQERKNFVERCQNEYENQQQMIQDSIEYREQVRWEWEQSVL